MAPVVEGEDEEDDFEQHPLFSVVADPDSSLLSPLQQDPPPSSFLDDDPPQHPESDEDRVEVCCCDFEAEGPRPSSK